jgi:hypothetical protein
MAAATQTIFTVGMPTLAVLVGILVKVLLSKIEDVDNRLTRLEERFAR